MDLFGVMVPIPYIVIGAVIILVLLVLIIAAIISGKKEKVEVEDLDKREEFGDFHGLLTKEDFDTRAEDSTLELYREQWIRCAPGDEKDNFLLLYLAYKQLIKEQEESEDEWTQEACEDRMDAILQELSEKTGLKLLEQDTETDEEIEEYFENLPEDGDEEDENKDENGEEAK